MSIISEQLINLRTKCGNTQEELAEYLNVSQQAVSKWESGESTPKVPLLPDIARFYNVTTNELLGGGEVRKRIKIEQFCKETKEHYDSGHIELAVDLWRKAYSEYPRDMVCVFQLMYSLHDLNSSVENSGVDISEIIDLGKTILTESTDDSIREKAITILCRNLCKCGRFDEAKEYARLAHKMCNSYEAIMSNILFAEGNLTDGKVLLEENFNNIVAVMCEEIEHLSILAGDNRRWACTIKELLQLFLQSLFPSEDSPIPENSNAFSKSVMKKIRAIQELQGPNRDILVEQYYQEHGSYEGLETWLSKINQFGKQMVT